MSSGCCPPRGALRIGGFLVRRVGRARCLLRERRVACDVCPGCAGRRADDGAGRERTDQFPGQCTWTPSAPSASDAGPSSSVISSSARSTASGTAAERSGPSAGQTRAARRRASKASRRACGPKAVPVAAPDHASAASETTEGSITLCIWRTARNAGPGGRAVAGASSARDRRGRSSAAHSAVVRPDTSMRSERRTPDSVVAETSATQSRTTARCAGEGRRTGAAAKAGPAATSGAAGVLGSPSTTASTNDLSSRSRAGRRRDRGGAVPSGTLCATAGIAAASMRTRSCSSAVSGPARQASWSVPERSGSSFPSAAIRSASRAAASQKAVDGEAPGARRALVRRGRAVAVGTSSASIVRVSPSGPTATVGSPTAPGSVAAGRSGAPVPSGRQKATLPVLAGSEGRKAVEQRARSVRPVGGLTKEPWEL